MAERRPSAGSSALNEALKNLASERYSLQGRTQVAPRVQTVQPSRPSFRSALSNIMRDAIDATGLEGGYRQGLLNAAGGVETAADFLPVVGDVLGLEDASRAYGQGDMLGTGINLMGVVPIVGDVASKAAKASRSNWSELPRTPNSDEKIIDIPISMIEHGEAAMSGGTLSFPDAQETIQEYAQRNTEIPAIDVVTPDEDSPFFMVEDGSRRLEAAKLRGDKTIKAIVPKEYNEAPQAGYSGGGRQGSAIAGGSALRGLDMNPEARMQRANEQQFLPETVYHGTAGDIRSFDPKTYGGSVTRANSARMGTWFSDNPEVSASYARFAAEDVPIKKLIEEAEQAERKMDFEGYEKAINAAEELESSGDLINAGGQNIIPARVRGKLFEIDVEGATMSDLDDSQLYKWAQEAKEKGFDGLKIKNFSDNADYGTYTPATHYLIFDPKNIRSTNAKFDPTKADSADLLSSRQSERQMSALRGIA